MQLVVCGGGLGGLLLARGAALDGHDVVVLERDAEEGARAQGYYIGLDADGLAAIDAVGLTEALHAVAEPPKDHRFAFAHSSGDVYFELSTAGTPPEYRTLPCHRGRLRGVLLQGARDAGAEFVFGARVQTAADHGDRAVVTFDGGEVSGDVVVGADGVRSLVRASLVGDDLISGLYILGGRLPDGGQVDAVGSGDLMVLGTGVSLFCGRYPSDDGIILNWGLGLSPELPLPTPDDAPAFRDELLTGGALVGWHPALVDLIAATEPAALNKRRLQTRPPLTDTAWAPGRVTLLGDAAHPMTPYRGKGGNSALQDAVVLRTQLAGVAGDDRAAVLSAVEAYNSNMFKRGAKVVQASASSANMFHMTSTLGTTMRGWGLTIAGKLMSLRR